MSEPVQARRIRLTKLNDDGEPVGEPVDALTYVTIPNVTGMEGLSETDLSTERVVDLGAPEHWCEMEAPRTTSPAQQLHTGGPMTVQEEGVHSAWHTEECLHFHDDQAVCTCPAVNTVSALVEEGWRPRPSGDVIEQAAKKIHDYGDCTCEDLSACLDDMRVLADAGLLATPVSIPVPPPDELVERVAQAIAYQAECVDEDERDVLSLLRPSSRGEYRKEARAAIDAIRAAGEGQQ